jgi:CDP-diglyceride synthetase
MMNTLTHLLVGKPLSILALAGGVAACWMILRLVRGTAARHPRALLVPVAALVLYAAWEWLVMTRSPEANIRVDLLLIWPSLVILLAWSIVRALR